MPSTTSIVIVVTLTIHRLVFRSFIGFLVRDMRHGVLFAQPAAQVNLSTPITTEWFRRARLRLELSFANGTAHRGFSRGACSAPRIKKPAASSGAK
jgi:hypothetical protein